MPCMLAMLVACCLSAPKGSSVNDFIPQEEFSVQYSKFDDAVDMTVSLGPIALMAKSDKISIQTLPC